MAQQQQLSNQLRKQQKDLKENSTASMEQRQMFLVRLPACVVTFPPPPPHSHTHPHTRTLALSPFANCFAPLPVLSSPACCPPPRPRHRCHHNHNTHCGTVQDLQRLLACKAKLSKEDAGAPSRRAEDRAGGVLSFDEIGGAVSVDGWGQGGNCLSCARMSALGPCALLLVCAPALPLFLILFVLLSRLFGPTAERDDSMSPPGSHFWAPHHDLNLPSPSPTTPPMCHALVLLSRHRFHVPLPAVPPHPHSLLARCFQYCPRSPMLLSLGRCPLSSCVNERRGFPMWLDSVLECRSRRCLAHCTFAKSTRSSVCCQASRFRVLTCRLLQPCPVLYTVNSKYWKRPCPAHAPNSPPPT